MTTLNHRGTTFLTEYYLVLKVHIGTFRKRKANSLKRELASADSAQDPPVPIPNTEVKLSSADNTWVATPWEDREVLAFLFKKISDE